MMLPDPVDHDARGERVRPARERLGQLQSAAPAGEAGRLALTQNCQEATRRGLAEVCRAAPDLDAHVERGLDVADRVQERVAGREQILEPDEVGAQGLE